MNLTSGSDHSPAWSPDYQKLAFVRNENNGAYIYVVGASGGRPKLLGPGYTPRWSPDGSKIAFAQLSGTGRGIFLMSATGKNVVQLTNPPSGSDFYPSWSPDGTKMAFASNRTGTHEIYIMDADGTDVDRLTSCVLEGAECSAPAWGPVANDDRILYWATLDPATQNQTSIRQVRTGGSNITIVAGTRFGRPAWTPDGSRIIFSKEVTPGNSEVFRVDFSGYELEQLTQNFLWDFDVASTH
jgi:TolB protein